MLDIMFSWKVSQYRMKGSHHGCDAVVNTRLGAKAFIPQSGKLYFGPVKSNKKEITNSLFN